MYTADKTRYQDMPYARCGASGLLLPRLSLGLWLNFGENADKERVRELLLYAFDHGVTHFDLANNYGPPAGSAELGFGRILSSDLAPYRDELVISTKAGYPMWEGPYGRGGSRKYLMSSLDQSLARMGLSYVDIFYHHCMDKETSLEETVTALADIVKSGKALYVGLSNYDGETMARASAMLKELHCPFVINQNRYNILDRTVEKNDLLAETRKEKKGLISFSPLAQGLLTDRYLGGIPTDSRIRTASRFLKESALSPELLLKIRALDALAKERGISLARLSLLWLLSQSEVTSVLVGVSKLSQLKDSLGAIALPPLTEEELSAIDRIVRE